MRKSVFLFLALLAFGLTSCDKNRIFEKNQDFEETGWKIDDVQSFTFEVKDTTKPYAVYFNVRNAIFYEYYNLYLKHTLTGPDGQEISSKLHELFLMDKTTGKPLGDGAGDIFDHQVMALKNQRFTQPGTYTIKLQQYMRRDPLPGIMAVGVRVETAE